MSKRILITGGSGLLAVNWALEKRDGNEVILGLHNRHIVLAGTRGLPIDLTSPEAISSAIQKIQPDLIVNTAGLTSVESCEQNPDLARKVNTDLASDISRASYSFGIPLVHISTDHIFPGDFDMADEETRPDPVNVYGYTKAEAETQVLANHPSALIIRTNFYGWGPTYRPSFSDQIINSLRNGIEISLFDDVFYTPILAETLIKGIHELLEKKAKGIYHVVGDDRISKYEFGRAIARHFGLDKALIRRLKMDAKPGLVVRPKDMSLSNKKTSLKIRRSLGGVDQHLKQLLQQEKSGFINEIIKL